MQRLGEANVALNHQHLSQKQTLPRLETPHILSTIIVFVLFIENKLIGLDLKHYILVHTISFEEFANILRARLAIQFVCFLHVLF